MNTDDMSAILSTVENMELSEGAYLEFSNLLKKQYDTKERDKKEVVRVREYNMKVRFHGKQCVEIELLANYVFIGSHPNEWRIKINGTLMTVPYLPSVLQKYYRCNYTTRVEVILDGATFDTTEAETRRYIASQRINPDDDEAEDVSGQEFSFSFILQIMIGVWED